MADTGNEPERFRFRRNMDLGSVDAETDQKFLQDAFVNNGYLDIMCDTQDRKSILVGRTGAGKTALLLRVEEISGRVVTINPEALSLTFLKDSIVRELDEAGVRMNLFYKLLWRHVIAVELLRDHYGLHSPEKQKTALLGLMDIFKSTDARKERAIEYLKKWGPDFWKGSQERVKEIIVELKKQIEASAGIDLSVLKVGGGGGGSVTEKQVKEVASEAQKVIESIRIEPLDDVLKLLEDEALADAMNPYYVLIDDLDQDWVDMEFAYDLIEALIQEVKEFASRENIKVIVALRENIVEQLHRRKQGPRGRQRIKQEALMVRLRWDPENLVDVLNARLAILLRAYYGGDVSVGDILPSSTRTRISGMHYILQRTFMRPRDAIHLMNKCIEEAAGDGQITWDAILAAEMRYSRERIRSLEDEWRENYPGVGILLNAMTGLHDRFSFGDFRDDKNRLAEIYAGGHGDDREGHVAKTASDLAREGHEDEAAEFLLQVLFRISAVGVQLPGRDRRVFSYVEPDLLDQGVEPGTQFFFHPGLYEALKVKDPLWKRDIVSSEADNSLFPGPIS